MNELQKETITRLVYTYAKKANITNENEINDTINTLCSMNINDCIDAILISLNDLLNRKAITLEDIYEDVEYIIKLNPEKYKSANDLIDRLNWIKEMNLEHSVMSLEENHRLVIEVFDEFNNLVQGKFDCYYTGGLMAYLATNHELERYHEDLDLFIYEKQLIDLKELVDSNPNFKFVSDVDSKGVTGHEYKIIYKDTPMSIGLFLFERHLDNRITTKSYYFDSQNSDRKLFVEEHHYSKGYTDMSFSNLIRYHNGIPYRMMSLESIYNSKKHFRPKDRYDAEIIKNDVDMMGDYKLDVESKNNFDVTHEVLQKCIIHEVELLIREQKDNNCNEISVKKDSM